MPEGLLDSQGHLTAAGLAAIATAPVGKGPTDLAAHVASCSRCQERMLAGAMGGASGPRERREPPPAWRIWAVLAAALLLLLSILVTLRKLS
jgi:hypothetical protein